LKKRWARVWRDAGARFDPLQLWTDFWSPKYYPSNKNRRQRIKSRLAKFDSPRVKRYSDAPVIELALWYSDATMAYNDALIMLGYCEGNRFAQHLSDLVRVANRENPPQSADGEIVAEITGKKWKWGKK